MRVLVTGGARRIGAAIVRRLAGSGHDVAVHQHAADADGEALVAAMRGVGREALLVAGDLADAAVPVRLVAEARAGWGGRPLEAVVNSASLFAWDTPALADRDLFDRHFHVNLAAPVALANALAAQDDLAEGAVVNLLDQKIANLNPDFFSYTCSKLALAGATEMLAVALAPRIRVNAVAPGLTLPSLDQSDAEFAAVASRNLLQRPVGAEAVAEAVAWLLDARSVTGQTLFVDGGQRFLKRTRDVMFETRGG